MAAKKCKVPARKLLPDEQRFSPAVEDALAEASEKIFTRLFDDGFIPDAIHKDNNMGEDVLSAIEDTIRKCIRG